MATLDRLREIVKNHRSSVPVVATDATESVHDRSESDGFSRRLTSRDETADLVNAAITLGGAVVERSDGAVIVVDREYRAAMLHGRTPIGEIVATITEVSTRCTHGQGVAVGAGH